MNKIKNHKYYSCDPQLLRWGKQIKKIERKTFEQRGSFHQYLAEEKIYCPETL